MELSEEQKLIINESSKYIQIIAAAGSGKTFTLIELVNNLISKSLFKEDKILLITFSKKAANEIQERLVKKIGNNKVKVYTFHAYCLRIISIYNPKYSKDLKIISPEEKLGFYKKELIQEKFLVGGIPYDLLLSTKNPYLKVLFPDIFTKIEKNYSKFKEINNLLDFDDLVKIYLNGLEQNEEWALKAKLEISYVIVDEFQDTDLIQLKWLQLINPENLTVVGDDWQAIYGFRGATTEPFLKFEQFFSPVKKLYLTMNYRSDINIIKTSIIPIKFNKLNIKKDVISFSKNNGQVGIITIESDKDWLNYLNILQENGKNKILVRANYRIKKLISLGFPENQISTIHKAKGLEFPTVILDLCEGWSGGEKFEEIDIEEERRILYVSLSRAKNKLLIVGYENYTEKNVESLFFDYFN
jgi:DNA helicase II / ATP-dependent DNA helicase PcrA